MYEETVKKSSFIFDFLYNKIWKYTKQSFNI